MAEFRVQQVEQDKVTPFDPREWLRREVLWNSVKEPYEMRIDKMQTGRNTSWSEYKNRLCQIEAHADFHDPALQSRAFMYHGKRVASVLSLAALYRLMEGSSSPTSIPREISLPMQAQVVDEAMQGFHNPDVPSDVPSDVYAFCAKKIRSIGGASAMTPRGIERNDRRRAQAADAMLSLGSLEVSGLLDVAQARQGGDGSPLPVLTIPGGGTSLSNAHPSLLSDFSHLVASETYATWTIEPAAQPDA